MKDDQALETEALATEMADEDDQDIIESNPENVDEGSKDFVEPDIAEQKDTTESVKYDEDTITTTKENIDDTAEAPKDETEKVTNAATIEDTIKDTGDEVAENDRASQEPVDSIIKDAEKEIQNLEIGDAKPDISGTSQEDEKKPFSPYDLVDENSPEVCESGKIVDMQENVIGTVNEVMAPKLAGFKVDKEGNVINHEGHIVAKAELYAPEEELFNPNPTIQKDSPEVRESGKVVDNEDNIVGAIDKQLASKLVGFKVNKDGDVINPEGHIVARAELIKVDEKDKPFNSNNSVDENSPEVKKSGKILDMDDNLVGYVDKGVASKLAGFKVDREGNIIDHEGHIVGRADMIKSEEEKEEEDKPFNPNPNIHPDSPEVRKSGKVLDMDDNIVGHVDKELAVKLAGFKVDPDGYIINDQGHTVGKAQMLERMTEEERKEQTEEEEYRKIANQMSQAIQQSLDKIKPILKEITDSIDDEESKSQKERDEQKLVDHVKPLIEQASSILQETNGAIRGLDPSGRIAKKAQGRTFERKASPEEHHLADLLAQLSGEVTTTIDKAKKKIRNMPHAKRELSPLWNILESPLLQILSGVGLLLTGVLGLVGR
jgi:isopentenyl phosphate kinase